MANRAARLAGYPPVRHPRPDLRRDRPSGPLSPFFQNADAVPFLGVSMYVSHLRGTCGVEWERGGRERESQ
eukprot:61275-Rhodomonas_salina.2